MIIGIPVETRDGETRVAATPETVKKFIAAGHEVRVQSGAGVRSSIPDEAYVAVGASIGSAEAFYTAEILLKVRAPNEAERARLKPGTVVVGMLNPFDADNIAADISEKLALAGKEMSFVIGHIENAVPVIKGEGKTRAPEQDYRFGERAIFKHGKLVSITEKQGDLSDKELEK